MTLASCLKKGRKLFVHQQPIVPKALVDVPKLKWFEISQKVQKSSKAAERNTNQA